LAELVAEGLYKNFGNFRALDDVSFKLEGKGCFGYLGPNGAGKTTTMKLFTSLLRPSSGRALVNGFEVARQPTLALKAVGSLIEDPEPYPFMTVQEFIGFAVKVRDENKKPDMAHLNELLELPPLDRKCLKLSKGQKRRVYIAALMAQDPEVFILDEPSAGLDPTESVVFRNTIIKLKKDKTVFLSSHLLYEVTQTCDQVMFINQGRIVERGTVQEISKKFTSKTLRVEFDAVVDEARLEALVESKIVLSYAKEGDRTYVLNFDGRDETRKAIVDEIYPMGIRSLQDAQLGLEQAYMDLMK
jgi:ABC-2 type transport system ATP-binding protein